MASAPRLRSLRGADIIGVELKLLPLGLIIGRIVVESAPDACDSKGKIPLVEFSPTATRDDLPKDAPEFLPWRRFSSPRANEKGEFTINNVDPGHYRIGMQLPGENLYLKTITAPANVPARRGAPAPVNNISRSGLALRSVCNCVCGINHGGTGSTGERKSEITAALILPRDPRVPVVSLVFHTLI